MEDKKLTDNLKDKIKEIKSIRGMSIRDLGFRNWHIRTVNTLKNFSSANTREINSFKKLTFTDTKYQRGKKAFDAADEEKYNNDLNEAEAILKKIVANIESLSTEKVTYAKKPSAIKKPSMAKKASSTKKTSASKKSSSTK
ncbi:MAG: hypothetical protein H8E13_03915 [Actinobacteria bacterium]|nr:hypothetical protein [Actinomycetota bacterium]